VYDDIDEEEEEEDSDEERHEPNAVTSSFSLRHLKIFMKSAALSERVRISLSADVPIEITYRVPCDDNAYVTYFLAPKIKDEDN